MRVERAKTHLEKADDLELLGRIRAQDSEAFEVLFHRYYTRVFAFVERRLHDPPLVEETVEDVFFEIWQNASAFQGNSRMSSWMFGIAHFKALEAHRHRSRAKRARVIPIAEALERAPDTRDEQHQLEVRDEIRNLDRAVRSLGEKQREVAELVWMEGLSHEEAAERLGISPNSVKTRLFRARERVREELGSTSPGVSG